MVRHWSKQFLNFSYYFLNCGKLILSRGNYFSWKGWTVISKFTKTHHLYEDFLKKEALQFNSNLLKGMATPMLPKEVEIEK